MNALACIRIAAVSAMLTVAMGAFGAHALKETLTESQLNTFETAVRYQMYHTLGLALVGLLRLRDPECRLLSAASWLLLLGIALFSGSLYALALSGIRWLGAITPLGGVAFIVAWACLGLGIRRHPESKRMDTVV